MCHFNKPPENPTWAKLKTQENPQEKRKTKHPKKYPKCFTLDVHS